MGQQLGFTIPAEDVIAGILVEWELNRGTGFAAIERVLLLDGTTELASKPSGATITTTDTYYAFGGSTDVWGASLTPELVNSASFGVGVTVQEVSFSSVTVGADHVRVTIFHSPPPNTAPTITESPTVDYQSGAALTPANSPATVTFTVTDAEQTGTNALSWQIRTAPDGGGTLVTSGTATSGVAAQAEVAWDASGLVEGAQTLYLRVTDGTLADEASFSLTMSKAQSAGMHHIGSTAMAYTPGVGAGGVSVGLQSVPATTQVHQAMVAPGGVSAGMMHLATSATLHMMAAVSLGVTIWAEHIAPSTNVHSPGAIYDQSVAMEHVASTLTVHTPGARYGQVAGMEHLANDGTLHMPAIVVGTAFIGMQHLATVPTLYQPAVIVGGVSVGLEHLNSAATLYLLAITAGPTRSSIAVASPRAEPLFYLAIYPPVGAANNRNRLDWIDINPNVTGLSWQSSMPGGFARLTAGIDHTDSRYDQPLADPLIPRELTLTDFAHLELTHGGLTLWEGRIDDQDIPPGGARTLAASGYGYTAVSDYPYFGTSTTIATTGAVLQHIVSTAAPALRVAAGQDFIDPQVPHAPVEFDGLYPSQVLQQITKEGNSAGDLMDWAVWQGRALHLVPRVAPRTAHYWVPFERRYVTNWKRHAKDRVGVVWVDHTVNDEPVRTGPIVDEWFTGEVGFQRGRILKTGEMTVAAALKLGQTYLRTHARARYTGTVVVGPDDTLIGPGGRPVPAYLVRAGEWVQVGDHEPLIIVIADYNANARRLKLQLGDRADTYQAQVARIMRDVELQKLGTNPLGGRTR